MSTDDQITVLAQALAAVKAITGDNYSRAEALMSLAHLLPSSLKPEALAVARAMTANHLRSASLTKLARYLLPEEQPDVLTEALTAATAITDDDGRAAALAELALFLPTGERTAALTQALAAARAITADLPPEVVDASTAITSDYVRAVALTNLASHLPSDKKPAVLAEVLAAIATVPEPYFQAKAISYSAATLLPDLLPEVLAVTATLANDFLRAQTLAALAVTLPVDKRSDVLAQALTAATAITDMRRALALSFHRGLRAGRCA
jgi:hypothetical protein